MNEENCESQSGFRAIPSIDSILSLNGITNLFDQFPRLLVKEVVKEVVEEMRKEIKEGIKNDILQEEIISIVKRKLNNSRLKRAINGTGVILHTNLGRAILSKKVTSRVVEILSHYSNLEFDLSTGERGKRTSYVESLLRKLTGAEDSYVVNNNAGAVLLMLSALAKGKEVIVSRGELVEIGGSFRVPEVMSQSGASMIEVGTTNKTRLSDYEKAITSNTTALMKVHTSNYRIVGFTEGVPLKDLVDLAHRYNLAVFEDLGSGLLQDYGIPLLKEEPTIIDSIKSGVDVVSFSGDKLLGGPQCGIILGKKEYLEKIKKHPLARALRVDKISLISLEATLEIYFIGDKVLDELPVLRLLTLKVEDLRKRGEIILDRIGENKKRLSLKEGFSTVGGGSLPTSKIPTILLSIELKSGEGVHNLSQTFRESEPPLVGIVEEERFLIDLRTVLSDEDEELVRILKVAL